MGFLFARRWFMKQIDMPVMTCNNELCAAAATHTYVSWVRREKTQNAVSPVFMMGAAASRCDYEVGMMHFTLALCCLGKWKFRVAICLRPDASSSMHFKLLTFPQPVGRGQQNGTLQMMPQMWKITEIKIAIFLWINLDGIHFMDTTSPM